MDTKKAASFRNISVLKKLSSKFSFPPCFRKSIFGIRKKKSCLVHSRQLLYLLLTYVYSMSCYTFIFTCSASYVQTARSMFLRHSVSYLFFSGMPSLFQLANPFLPCRFSGGGNAELLQEYPATSPIIVSSVFFLKVNNPFYVRWDPFIYPLGFDCQPSVVSG